MLTNKEKIDAISIKINRLIDQREALQRLITLLHKERVQLEKEEWRQKCIK